MEYKHFLFFIIVFFNVSFGSLWASHPVEYDADRITLISARDQVVFRKECTEGIPAVQHIISRDTIDSFVSKYFNCWDPTFRNGFSDTSFELIVAPLFDYDKRGMIFYDDEPFDKTRCVDGMVLFLHGFANSIRDSKDNFKNVTDGLHEETNGQYGLDYGIHAAAYTWPSDTSPPLETEFKIPVKKLQKILVFRHRFESAKSVVSLIAPQLKNMLKSYNKKCEQSKIRVIAHSLGSLLILEALNQYKGPTDDPLLDSLHVFAAAVPVRKIVRTSRSDRDPVYRDDIKQDVAVFFHYFSTKDLTLNLQYINQKVNLTLESLVFGDTYSNPDILGQTSLKDFSHFGSIPSNICQRNVTDRVGFDHSKYLDDHGGVWHLVAKDIEFQNDDKLERYLSDNCNITNISSHYP